MERSNSLAALPSTTASGPATRRKPHPPLLTRASSMSAFNYYRSNRVDYVIAMEELNVFYQFKNRLLYREYLLYNLNTKPYSAVVFLIVICMLILLPIKTIFLVQYSLMSHHSSSSPSTTTSTGYLAVNIVMFLCLITAIIIGSLYVIERTAPNWKIYQKLWVLVKRCYCRRGSCRFRRYAVIDVITQRGRRGRRESNNEGMARTASSTSALRVANQEDEDNDDDSDDDDDEDDENDEEKITNQDQSLSYSRLNSYLVSSKQSKKNAYGSMSKKIVVLQQCLLISLMVFSTLFFINTCFQENCVDYKNAFFNAILKNCSKTSSSTTAKDHASSLLETFPFVYMLSPILLSCIFRETLFELQIIHHFAVIIVALIFTILYQFHVASVLIIAIWAVMGLSILIDLHVHNVAAFLTSYELREILLEKERTADRAAAAEMRHMIGNVAHDLKTPLASFTTGLEIISDIIESNEKMIQLLQDDHRSESTNASSTLQSATIHTPVKEPSVAVAIHQTPSFASSPPLPRVGSKNNNLKELQENNVSVKQCLQNIRDTNTFMLMTINRCIDYTKASRGFKLIPKFETVDLLETLRLPLDCMKNIQERIDIALKPFDMKEICSHIITDKQWLQENILCLLSNAVKYSNGGEVTIAVCLTKIEKPVRKNIDSILTKRTSVPSGARRQSLSELFRKQFSVASYFSGRSTITGGGLASERRVSQDSVLDSEHLTPTFAGQSENFMKSVSFASVRGNDNSLFNTASKNVKTVSRLNDVEEGTVNPAAISNSSESNNQLGITSTEEKKDLSPVPAANPMTTYSLRFEVEDTGIGMSTEAMCQLFSPFRQAQRLAGGTGLGLYSLAKRVEALNGSYGVNKRVDGKQGSLFWFSIPYRPDYATSDLFASLVNANDVNSEESENSAAKLQAFNGNDPNNNQNNNHTLPIGRSLTPPVGVLRRRNSLDFGAAEVKLPSLHILLVDDSPSIVKMSSIMLKRQGYILQTADNGENALKKIQQQWEQHHQGFDVILMDLQMPVMDGLEATRRLRILEKQQPSWIYPSSFKEKLEVEVSTSEETNEDSKSTRFSVHFPQENKFLHFYQSWCQEFSAFPYHHAVIGVSANSDDETAKEAIEAGVDAFLPKPFSMDMFSSTVIKVLSKIYDSFEQRQQQQQQQRY